MMIEMRCDCLLSGDSKDDVICPFIGTDVISAYDSNVEKDIVNQGVDGSCVSQCLYEMQRYMTEKWRNKKSMIDRLYVYDRRKDKLIQGMTPREGLNILKSDGIIDTFLRIPSMLSARQALVSCGPILLALPVYTLEDDFWNNKYEERRPHGYHAVTATAYDEQGFMFKNSWGYEWGDRGYGFLPVEDWNKVIESWVIAI